MRAIKFRVWHKTEKKMYELEGIDLTNHDKNYGYITVWDGYGQIYDSINKADAILMQFTGLLDKNGKEIYEGDIVRRYGKFAFQVKWSHDFCGFQPLCEYRNDYGLPNAGESSALTEVIGNIYEHPELLQQTEN